MRPHVNKAFDAAIKRLGGPITAAKAMDITPAAVSRFATGDRPLPLERCVELEQLSGVACELLRPDKLKFWTYLRSTKRPEA